MTAALSITGVAVTASAPVLEQKIDNLAQQLTAFEEKVLMAFSTSEQQLIDAETNLGLSIAAAEARATAASNAQALTIAQLNSTVATMGTTISNLQAQLANGSVGGAGAAVVQQAINDLATEKASADAFLAANPPLPPAAAPPADGSGSTAAPPSTSGPPSS